MTITPQNLIALLPLLITGLTVVVVMLSIAWRRNHKQAATLTIAGLGIAFLSTFIALNLINDPTVIHSKLTGIALDPYYIYFSWLVIIAAIATCVLAYPWLESYPDNKEEFYLLLLIATLGALLLTCSDHLATMFLGIELLSLPMFGLIGYAYRRTRSLEASIKYMVLSATASSFLVFGIALLYAANGSLSFAGLGALILQGKTLGLSIQLVGFGLLLVGFGFKLSLAPFHLWTPDVYEGAPASVSGFLATVGKIGAFCVLARLLLTAPIAANEAISFVLALFAFCSILIGNVLALRQNNLKRILGYSSIAHLGYLLIIVVVIMSTNTSESGVFIENRVLVHESIYVYIVGYVLSSIIAFGIVSLNSSPYGAEDKDSLSAYKGLFWQKPVYAFSLVVAMLSLAGIPLTLGFIGKFLVIMVGVKEHLWWLVAAVVAGSAMGLYYYLRVAITLFQQPQEGEVPVVSHLNYPVPCVLLVFCAVVILLFGILPNPLIALGNTTTLLSF